VVIQELSRVGARLMLRTDSLTFIFERMKKDSSLVSALLCGLMFITYVSLVFRSAGLYPMIFGDEWHYSSFSRLYPLEHAVRPLYIYFGLYSLTNFCGDAYLECARQLNAIVFALSLPFIFFVSRRFVSRVWALYITFLVAISPFNLFTIFFIPEPLYFLVFWMLIYFLVLYSEGSRFSFVAVCFVLSILSMVKPHAIFVVPTIVFLILYVYLANNFQDFRKALIHVLGFMGLFLFFRLIVGYALAGPRGLNILGSDYGAVAGSMDNYEELASLAMGALYSARGLIFGLVLLFAPALVSALVRIGHPEKTWNIRFGYVRLLTLSLIGTLLLVMSFFHAKAVGMGPYESIERLSFRHFDFMFPLFFILAAMAVDKGADLKVPKYPTILLVLLSIVVVSYVVMTGFTGYRPSFNDSPELHGMVANHEFFVLTAILTGASLVTLIFRFVVGLRIYLLVVVPTVLIGSGIFLQKQVAPRYSADIFDSAGIVANKILGSEAMGLVVVGPDLANVMRTLFYINAPLETYLILPLGSEVDESNLPDGTRWVLTIGGYKTNLSDSKVTTFRLSDDKVDLVEINSSSFSANLSGPVFEFKPSRYTLHTTGVFDEKNQVMLSVSEEGGTLAHGQNIKLSRGKYVAVFEVLAMASKDHISLGTIDVTSSPTAEQAFVVGASVLRSSDQLQSIRIPFEVIDSGLFHQFRVWIHPGPSGIGLKNIKIYKI
jgi:phosphoglycerol transferase